MEQKHSKFTEPNRNEPSQQSSSSGCSTLYKKQEKENQNKKFAFCSSLFSVANEIQFNVDLHAAKGIASLFFFPALRFIECERLTNHRTGHGQEAGRAGAQELPAAVS